MNFGSNLGIQVVSDADNKTCPLSFGIFCAKQVSLG
jgi:hypothetical protein